MVGVFRSDQCLRLSLDGRYIILLRPFWYGPIRLSKNISEMAFDYWLDDCFIRYDQKQLEIFRNERKKKQLPSGNGCQKGKKETGTRTTGCN